VSAPVAAVSIAGIAPTISTGVSVSVGSVSVTIAPVAPMVTISYRKAVHVTGISANIVTVNATPNDAEIDVTTPNIVVVSKQNEAA
jgi:hypothetical protein